MMWKVILRSHSPVNKGLDNVGCLEELGVIAHHIPEEAEVTLHDTAQSKEQKNNECRFQIGSIM